MRLARCLTFIIINVFAFSVNAQDISETEKFGNQLYDSAEYANAIEVYKRVLFFDTDGWYGPRIYRKIADCLYETEAFTEAATYYELAYFAETDDSVKTDLVLQKASCFLLLRDYTFAQEELFSLSEEILPSQLLKRKFFEGMLYFALEDFTASETLFKEISADTLTIHELFRANEKVSKISPKKAKILSIIFPGLGQFYAGDIKNGINSMLLTSGLFYLGLRSAANTSFFDAAISVLPWFQRYYTGGFAKAEQIAVLKKQQKRHRVFNEIIDEVEKQ